MEIIDVNTGKTNPLFNLTSCQPDIGNIYLYDEDPHEAKYKLLTNKRESTSLKFCKHYKVSIEYLNDMDDIYENMEEYNSGKEYKILIVYNNNMIADLCSNKRLNPIA